MKRIIGSLVIYCCSTGIAAAQSDDVELPSPDFKSRAGYAVGFDFGSSLQLDQELLDADAIVKGLLDGLNNAQPKLTDDELGQVMKQFSAVMAKRRGARFLVENQQAKGVQVTASGLQYLVLKPGQGASPAPTDTVVVHYEGSLLSGSVFDSSIARNQPAEFPVNGVISGWTEALQLMKVGAQWRLFIPSELAYGARGTPGGPIGPHEVLVFDVELISVKPAGR